MIKTTAIMSIEKSLQGVGGLGHSTAASALSNKSLQRTTPATSRLQEGTEGGAPLNSYR
jgi:hypothetical protein